MRSHRYGLAVMSKIFLPRPVGEVGFGSCRGCLASVMDLWGVPLEKRVYLWKCSTLGSGNMEKNPWPAALGISFPN